LKYLIKQIKINWLIYLILLGLILTFRILILIKFSFKYTDSDQTIMWLGLKNYANGAFYEPRFYGQSYNTMFEALLAIPLNLSNIPPFKALPIISSLLSILPFILISLLVFLKKSKIIGLIILSIPLLLPIEYSLITSLPRGFVTGIFFSSFGVLCIFYPKSKGSFFFSAFFSILAFSINSNSILLSLPYLFYLFLQNVSNKHYYFYSNLGVLIGFLIHFSLNYFYLLNPSYNLHKLDLSFSFKKLFLSFNKLDLFFNDVTPLFWSTGFLVLFMFILISFFLFRIKKYFEAIIVFFIPIFIIFTLGINKVHDGVNSIFFSYSRMYLSIPLLLAVSISFFSKITKIKYIYFFFLIPPFCFFYNLSILQKRINSNVDRNKNHVVSVVKTSLLINECTKLKNLCAKYRIQLIVISNLRDYYDSFNYGCPACLKTFPNTLRPIYERRTWRLIEDEHKIYKNILIIDDANDLSKLSETIIKIKKSYYLIKSNKMKTIKLFDKLKIKYRPFR
jgi:hypothetical protein